MSEMEKNDVRVETTLTESAADDLIAVARLNGKTKSEWLRDLILCELYGQLGMLRARAGLVKPENPRG